MGWLSSLTATVVYVLWACGSQGWERDYIRELFSLKENFVHIDLAELQNKPNSTIKPRVIVYNVENSGADGKYQIIRDLLTTYPTTAILVHTSDEFMGNSRKWKYGEGVEVYRLVPLVLRQYSIFPYRSYGTTYPNVMQIPLGYMKDMFKINDSVVLDSITAAHYSLHRLSSQRNYSWSFIGTVQAHKERGHALNVFSKWEPHLVSSGLRAEEMREIYNNSKFVLVGRGQANLDCFRIYEAIIAGAVPILVGSTYELERAFEFEGDFPPFLFAESYEKALEISQQKTNEEINIMREKVVKWYIDRISLIKRRIRLFLDVYPS